MTDDAERSIADLAVLFELSQAIGDSLDLHTCCDRFLRTLMARKNLAYAAVWLDSAALPGSVDRCFQLVYGSPGVHVAARELPLTHPLAERVRGGPFSVCSRDEAFAEVVHERRVSGGTYSVFPLEELGYLKLYTLARHEPFDAVAINQLQTLARKFTSALRGCLAHAKVVHDAALRERLEDELRQVQKLEAVGQLAGGIAHDFNNLVAAISGFAELLTLPGIPPERAAEYGERILGACDRASALTAPLLAFSRRSPVAEVVVPLDDIVDQVVDMLARTIDPRIALRVDRVSEGLVVRGDAAQLHALVLNLALNARDAQPDGGVILFRTHARRVAGEPPAPGAVRPGRYAELEVIDEGHGMEPDVRARAFEPFFTTKPVGRGTGLGLAIAYGTVLSHGGSIGIDSFPGRGTRVRVLLPTCDQPIERPPMSPTLVRAELGRVLLVDDEPLVREAAHQMLAALGVQVTTAPDGERALALFAAAPDAFDAAIVDLVMPGMDGAAVLRALREVRPSLPVLVASGFGHANLMREIEALRPEGFLQKPFRLASLAEQLSRVLEPPTELRASSS